LHIPCIIGLETWNQQTRSNSGNSNRVYESDKLFNSSTLCVFVNWQTLGSPTLCWSLCSSQTEEKHLGLEVQRRLLEATRIQLRKMTTHRATLRASRLFKTLNIKSVPNRSNGSWVITYRESEKIQQRVVSGVGGEKMRECIKGSWFWWWCYKFLDQTVSSWSISCGNGGHWAILQRKNAGLVC
jgi:hypothetical protein